MQSKSIMALKECRKIRVPNLSGKVGQETRTSILVKPALEQRWWFPLGSISLDGFSLKTTSVSCSMRMRISASWMRTLKSYAMKIWNPFPIVTFSTTMPPKPDRGVPEDPGAGGLLSAGEEPVGRGTSHLQPSPHPLSSGSARTHQQGPAKPRPATRRPPKIHCSITTVSVHYTEYRHRVRTRAGNGFAGPCRNPYARFPDSTLSREWFYQSQP